MILVGLTGGIGSGKSVVSDFLRICEIPVYNSDFEAKRLMQSSQKIRDGLLALFGEKAFVGESLNRNYIASLVFGDEYLLAKLNAIVHPEVRLDFQNWVLRQVSNIVVLESAIVFDTGLSEILDVVIAVSAPLELRIQRVIGRDRLTAEQVQQRIDAQMDEQIRLNRSDFVVINDGVTPIIPQIMTILEKLMT